MKELKILGVDKDGTDLHYWGQGLGEQSVVVHLSNVSGQWYIYFYFQTW